MTTDVRASSFDRWDWRVAVTFVVGALVALRSAGNLLALEPVPWALVVGAAIAIFAVWGPFAWLARGLLEASTRELAVLIAVGVAVLAVPFVVTATMVLELPTLRTFDAFVVGGVVGIAVVALVERTGLPERLVEMTARAIEADARA